MLDTSIWPDVALATTWDAISTAIPPTLSPITSHSPVCSPALISRSSERADSLTADAARIARAGPSKVAKS